VAAAWNHTRFLSSNKNKKLVTILYNFLFETSFFQDFDAIYAINIIFPRDFQYTDGRILCNVFVTFSAMSNIAVSFEFCVSWYLHNIRVIYK
jgi:hypothetical protein